MSRRSYHLTNIIHRDSAGIICFQTEEQVQQAPAFDAVPEYLTAPSHRILPPTLRCSYLVSQEPFEALAAERDGYTWETKGDSFRPTGIAEHIAEEIDHDAELKAVWYQGQYLLLFSLCDGWDSKPTSELKVPGQETIHVMSKAYQHPITSQTV
ncbi:hypothetical protein BJ138DRAFT_1154700 [Hygrophoropsis aurantiaca]|uniref:Uncharacterized protein n=1 Tax=Hygrophoropsis aurantiaca TaxID=72124 RepID=A0ACB8A9B1_9AGAM|nr:hypothetical protein BJ138DRAFT_1154700 [Hygrophoropsis aurantiaca]